MAVGASHSTGDQVEGVCEDEAQNEVADGHLDEGEEQRNARGQLVLTRDPDSVQVQGSRVVYGQLHGVDRQFAARTH